jgi:hypothetical protein
VKESQGMDFPGNVYPSRQQEKEAKTRRRRLVTPYFVNFPTNNFLYSPNLHSPPSWSSKPNSTTSHPAMIPALACQPPWAREGLPGIVRREFEKDTVIGGMVIETCGRVLQSMEIHEWGHDRPRGIPTQSSMIYLVLMIVADAAVCT